MNPAQDAAYRVHQCQAARRSRTALAYDQFCARLPDTYETDLSGLLAPGTAPSHQSAVVGDVRFELGEVCLTPNAAGALPRAEVLRAVARHAAGDWGNLDAHDRQQNERALRTRGRLVSVYEASNGVRFYVITDAEWRTTTVLLPEDY